MFAGFRHKWVPTIAIPNYRLHQGQVRRWMISQLVMVQNSITVNHPNTNESTAEKPARKKPARKPRPKAGDVSSATNTDAPKPKRIRKPRDPNAPPAKSRKKAATTSESTNGAESSRQPKITDTPGMADERFKF
ncbi:hypothetical protein DID88_001728 [Monilinia fructigena]|uniref:Uncharacterized protein n=1 Tax=Monilinia fructigena TaxID=38457 RepID=A0A395IXH6_9HELO|nr:hypothetical protein DID88_001728 [Monilinia fructigena]